MPPVKHLSDGSPDGACDSAGDRSNTVKSNICFKSAVTEPSTVFDIGKGCSRKNINTCGVIRVVVW